MFNILWCSAQQFNLQLSLLLLFLIQCEFCAGAAERPILVISAASFTRVSLLLVMLHSGSEAAKVQVLHHEPQVLLLTRF